MLVTRCAQARPVPKTQTNSRLARRARFDRHRLVASPSSGACRRRCRRFGFPVRAGKTPSSNGMPRSRAETWIQARAAHGPERASRLRRGSPGLDSGPLGRPLFRRCTALSATRSPLWRKRDTRKSRLETKTENEASSALLAPSLVTPTPAKPRQPRRKSHPSLQCHNLQDWVADGAGWSYPVSAKGGPAFGGNPQTEKPVEIQEVSSFAHLLTFLTRTKVLRKGCFTPSRVSTMMPISFHPLPLQ